jgi:thioredoxin 1
MGHATVMELDDKNFSKVGNDALPCLVDFWAPWCMPCRMLAPTIEEIAQQYEGKLKVYKVNIDQAQNTAVQYKIMSIPTLAIFQQGQLKDKITGFVPKESVVAKLRPYIIE